MAWIRYAVDRKSAIKDVTIDTDRLSGLLSARCGRNAPIAPIAARSLMADVLIDKRTTGETTLSTPRRKFRFDGVSVIIPCYNEERCIADTVRDVRESLTVSTLLSNDTTTRPTPWRPA